jgi:hypothetical protein
LRPPEGAGSTNRGPDEVRTKARPDLVAAGYVKKPFHLDDLNKVVAEVLAA